MVCATASYFEICILRLEGGLGFWGPRQAEGGLISQVFDRRGGEVAAFCRWMVVEVNLCLRVCVLHAGAMGEHFPFLGYVFAFSPPCGRSLRTLPSDLHGISRRIVFHAWQDLSSVAQLTSWYESGES